MYQEEHIPVARMHGGSSSSYKATAPRYHHYVNFQVFYSMSFGEHIQTMVYGFPCKDLEGKKKKQVRYRIFVCLLVFDFSRQGWFLCVSSSGRPGLTPGHHRDLPGMPLPPEYWCHQAWQNIVLILRPHWIAGRKGRVQTHDSR